MRAPSSVFEQTRISAGEVVSNIVLDYGHTTIPRHLRDIVVTEYGIADLRGKCDEDIIRELLSVADSRFQNELAESAKVAGKLHDSYELPEVVQNNFPARIEEALQPFREQGHFPPFPLGCEFTSQEIALAKSLRDIKDLMDDPKALVGAMLRSFLNEVDAEEAAPYLERIGLEHPGTPKEVILKHLLLLELEEDGYLRSI